MKTTISLFAQIAQLIPKQRFKNFYFISTTFPGRATSYPMAPPQSRTSAINASGSSKCGLAT